MACWRTFLQGNDTVPGPIDNKALKHRIEKRRAHMDYPESDEELGFKDKEDFYILSVGFFRFFYDTFGCNQIIH